MTKKTISLTIDIDCYEWARKNLRNISGDINDYLERCKAIHEEDVDGVSIQILQIDKAKAEKKVLLWSSKLKALQTKIKQYQEIQEKKEKERLQREKKIIEDSEKCIGCSTKVTPKWHTFDKGKVCNSCFMNARAKQFSEWTNGGK